MTNPILRSSAAFAGPAKRITARQMITANFFKALTCVQYLPTADYAQEKAGSIAPRLREHNIQLSAESFIRVAKKSEYKC